ncbi:hypothetical protein Z043_111435 [Scleropages formosus]|uniref:SAM domain-containing protein n=1 Tax=Scleropages formosus TaxID=113540 RepID=A0A0P7UIQ0_SCLFO|nr:hypothetical protein Z043_111435 [Scleropages formosus]
MAGSFDSHFARNMMWQCQLSQPDCRCYRVDGYSLLKRMPLHPLIGPRCPAQSVGQWLDNIGLVQYENHLLANGFDNVQFMVSDTFLFQRPPGCFTCCTPALRCLLPVCPCLPVWMPTPPTTTYTREVVKHVSQWERSPCRRMRLTGGIRGFCVAPSASRDVMLTCRAPFGKRVFALPSRAYLPSPAGLLRGSEEKRGVEIPRCA